MLPGSGNGIGILALCDNKLRTALSFIILFFYSSYTVGVLLLKPRNFNCVPKSRTAICILFSFKFFSGVKQSRREAFIFKLGMYFQH